MNIVSETDGILLKKIPMTASKFNIDSNRNLILHVGLDKIQYYSLDGTLSHELLVNNLKNAQMLDFILDRNDIVSFSNLQEFSLYQLENCYNLNIQNEPPKVADTKI